MILAIFNAIAALPAILGLVKSFASWLSDQIEQAEKRKLMADMAKAAEDAKAKKDTSGLDNAFDPGKKK